MSRRFWIWAISVLAVAVLVAGVVITAIAGVNYRDTRAAEDARGEALDAGKQTAALMFGYEPDNVEQNVEQTRKALAGDAQKQYNEIITEADLVAEVRKQQVKSEVTIQEAGVVSADAEKALILIFMNQSVTKGGKDLVSVEASRLQYSMVRSGDKWLVSNIDILTDDSVKARLAEEGNKVGSSTVPAPASSGSPTPAVPTEPAAPAEPATPATPAPSSAP
jgi:Mce-associated membrane protein